MNLIERYVYVVTTHLNEAMREDVKEELTANIYDMLSDNPQEEEIKKVLEKLGDPVKLANEYANKKRYLIGPEIYDTYVSVLKMLLCIVPLIAVTVSVLKDVLNPANTEITLFITNIIKNGVVTFVESVIHVIFWVTVVFFSLERGGINEGKLPFIKKKWSIAELENEQVIKEKKLSRVETVFTLVFTAIFSVIILFVPKIFGWYEKSGDNIVVTEPFFNLERLKLYYFVIITMTVILIFLQVWKFIIREWNLPLAVVNAIYHLAYAILMIVMTRDMQLFNEGFMHKVANVTKFTYQQVTNAYDKSLLVIMILIIIGSIVESAKGFYKSLK